MDEKKSLLPPYLCLTLVPFSKPWDNNNINKLVLPMREANSLFRLSFPRCGDGPPPLLPLRGVHALPWRPRQPLPRRRLSRHRLRQYYRLLRDLGPGPRHGAAVLPGLRRQPAPPPCPYLPPLRPLPPLLPPAHLPALNPHVQDPPLPRSGPPDHRPRPGLPPLRPPRPPLLLPHAPHQDLPPVAGHHAAAHRSPPPPNSPPISSSSPASGSAPLASPSPPPPPPTSPSSFFSSPTPASPPRAAPPSDWSGGGTSS